jgi:ABC-type multidrug transport system ATPase subunit
MGLPQHIVSCGMQESKFVPTLTVWETLGLTMRLRTDRKMSREEREEILNGILSSMGLSKVKNSRVSEAVPPDVALSLQAVKLPLAPSS